MSEDVITGCRAGDPAAFSAFVQAFQLTVYRLCLRYLQDLDDAADTAQEAFIRMHRAFPDFRGDSAIATWVYRVASSACLDRLRRRGRDRSVPTAEPWEARPGGVAAAGASGPDPAGIVLAQERDRQVQAAVAALPPHYRMVIVLYHWEERSYRDIGAILSIRPKTVETRLYRARQLLRRRLSGMVDEGGDDDAAAERDVSAVPAATARLD